MAIFAGLLSLLLIAIASWQGILTVEAADAELRVDGQKWEGTYVLKKKAVSVNIHDSDIGAGQIVTWTSTDPNVVQITADASASTVATMEPKGLGETTITAVYRDSNGAEKTFIGIVQVPSAILEDSSYFDYIHTDGSDTDAVMILENGQEGELGLLYNLPAGTNVTWSTSKKHVISMSRNDYVESVTSEKGYFRAVGTGVCYITVSYTGLGGKLEKSTVKAYVGPDVTIAGAAPSGSTAIQVKKGDYISLGGNMADNNETISDKVYWALVKKDGGVVDKIGSTGEYLGSTPYSGSLRVNARAGTYFLYVFTKETFSSEDPAQLASNNVNTKLKQVVELKVLPEPKDEPEIRLQVGDSYDIADVFNMSAEDFYTYFFIDTTTSIYSDRGDWSENTGVFTATSQGQAKIVLKIRDGKKTEFEAMLGSRPQEKYTIVISIFEGFSLDRTSVSIAVGASLALQTVYGGSEGVVTWKTADATYVKISDEGVITGVRATNGSFVKVTASMKMQDGRILTASCLVEVSPTVEKIVLDETDLTIKVDSSAKLTASFEPQEITTADLKWLIMDESIAEVTVTSKKTALITGKRAGSTILTVLNKDNYVTAYCKITVISPIKTISLDYETLTMRMSQEFVKLRATYTPSDATANKLKWSSSATNVATVDEQGFVTFVGPGSTFITVQPEWNEYNIMAQCRLTVIASPTAFSLDKTSLAMEVGDKQTIKPVLTAPESQTTIKWSSMDASVATVADGAVTAVAPGQTYIVANTTEGFVANCKVTVTKKASGITLTPTTIDIAVGETYEVDAKPNPANSTETKFTWTVKEPSVATVNNKGEVTGVSAGSTLVIVKTKSGDIAYLYVNVYDKAKGMTLNYSDKTVAKGKTFTLKPIFTPSNVTNKKVTWKSLKTSVATISDKGKVKGIRGGSAIITAVSDDGGYMATCLVTVVQPVSKVKLNYSSYKLGIGKTVGLKATVTSNSSSNSKVKWTSSNTSVASVSSSGKVKGKKLGTCTITARATDGSGKKATCKIRVVRQVSSISLNKPVLTLTVSQTKKLTAKVSPSNATYKTVKWSSSNKDVAVVDTKGNVTGLTVGTTTIKASAKDNSKESASCYVNVIDPIPASGIVVSAKDIILIRGQSQMISYTITPSNHTDKVTFASDNKAIATVTSTGKIYARRTGAATITITTSSGKQATINVTVIGLNKTSITLEQYDTETLIVDGVSTGITWYSSNPSIATVAGGKVVARKRGTCMIYATVSGITLSCRVTVKNISKS